MDENIASPEQPPVAEAPAAGPQSPEDSEPVSDQVFDVTPDLNISPVTDESVPLAQSTIVVPPVPVAPAAAEASPQQQTAPANPAAKTIESPSVSPSLPEKSAASMTSDSGEKLGLKRLRTYEGDIADLMSRRHTSATSIALAEQKQETGTETLKNSSDAAPSHMMRNLLIIVASIALIAGGSIGGYYLYTHSLLYTAAGTPGNQQQSGIIPSIVTADAQAVIHVDAAVPGGVRSLVGGEAAKTQKAGTIKEIIPVITVNNAIERVSASDMLKLMRIPAPDILARSLTDQWMLGIYADAAGAKNVFVVITDNFFQNTFAGMLQWEQTMVGDLTDYLPAHDAHGRFVDRIIRNKDVREYVTDAGDVLFLYSFVDNSRLVIAGNEATLTEILTRLEKQAFVR